MLMEMARFKRMAVEERRAPSAVTKRAGASTEMTLRKEYLGPVQVLGERQIRFTISTGAVDRAQDVIDQSGWDLSGYRKNPVVLLQHNAWDFPIGKCVDIGLEGGDLRATVEFVPADMPSGLGELAETTLRLCKEGFMSATSVGFRPIDWDVTADPARGADDWLPGFDFRKQDLTEFSIVTVPCNSEAVIDPAHREQLSGTASLLDIVSSAPGGALRAKNLRRLFSSVA